MVRATKKVLTYLFLLTALMAVATSLFAGEPRFDYELKSPPGYIAPYPHRFTYPIISITYQSLPKLKMMYSTASQATSSNFDENSLTFTAAYYKKGGYVYEYTPRSVDADAFSVYRRRMAVDRSMSDIHSKALSKEQNQKRGGLLSVNIPIKSKAVESIFGEGGAGLNVSGYHQIVFSGRSQWDDRSVTSTYRQSKFPSLNMEQISRFDIKGTIGSKVSVSVSQDSKTDIPLANRIIIRYKGEEDDIIRNIEAGNTTLSLPKTQLVGYSSRIQGLFGIKTEAQIGGLALTAIASQEKGSTERTTINAGASASKIYIRDWQYDDGKISDLGIEGVDFKAGDIITQINVFSSRKTDEVTADSAEMFVNPDDTTKYSNENSGIIEVYELQSDDFSLNGKEHWIMFSNPGVLRSQFVGVYMVIVKADGDTVKVGNIDTNPMQLKLIKNKNPDASMFTWDYAWRNVYYLKATNIDLKGLEINIYEGESGTEISNENYDNQDGTQYIRILGLDRYDPSRPGIIAPDGNVDVNTPIIEPEYGLLIFPNRTPFNPTENFDSVALDPTVPEIYDYSYSATEAQQASKYYIEVSNRSRNSEISLGRFNIIENSEIITLNGTQLTKGSDYRIDYDIGRVTFLTDEALDPNANLGINFEYSPFAMIQKKTLFGIRGEYEVNKNFELGTTFLYKSDKATERKPKVGQETTRMIIWDANTRFSFKSNLITKAANVLPFYSSETPSSFAVTAEVAQSYPNPNVDGVAYLDDFEGSRDLYSLGVYRENWYISSRPVGLDSTNKRAKMFWYNPYNQTAIKDIWDRDIGSVSHTHTLELKFMPKKIDRRLGEYVHATDSVADPSISWGGIMRYLSTGAADQTSAQLIELRLNGHRGILHIDMGSISEDLNGDGYKTTEDKNNNNYLDSYEDIGLDGMTDAAERDTLGIQDTDDPNYNDPNGDNFYYSEETQNDYSQINGTQGDSLDPGTLGRPSTEDMNRDGYFNKDKNNYFSYKIDLSDPMSPFYVEGSENSKGWRSFRVPLKDSTSIDRIVGEPLWTGIEYVRLWMEDPEDQASIPDTILLKIAAIDIVSSNWDDSLIRANDLDTNTRFSVGVINTQENEDYARNTPPGVEGYYDQINQVVEPEQSLLLHMVDFTSGIVNDSFKADTGIAERLLFDTPNLMGYRRLNMWVHGPEYKIEGDHIVRDSILFFFRVGTDNKNYYEYRRILTPDWEGNEVEMDFNEITGLKEYLVRAKKVNSDTNVIDSVINGKVYRVVGDPNITRVKYLAAGAANIDRSDTVTADIWIDELRLTDVRRDVGTAMNIGVSGTFADLFNYSVGYNYSDSYFRTISATTRGGSSDNLGSGSTSKRLTISLSGINLDKFLPRSFGASLPVSLSYSKSTSIPVLRSRSDIILPEELRGTESTVSTSKRFNISESFSKKTKNPLFTLLLNPLKGSFSYNRTDSRSPTEPMRISESYNIRGSYSYTIKSVPSIKPFFWTKPVPLLKKMGDNKFYLLPNTFSCAGTFDRSLTVVRNVNNVLNNAAPRRNFSGNMNVGYKISDNLVANYKMTTARDLSDPTTVVFSFDPKKFKLGRETSYSQDFNASYGPNIFAFLTHKFTFNASYRENIDIINAVHRASASRGYSVGGSLDFKKLFGMSSQADRRSSKYKRRQAIRGKNTEEKKEGEEETEKDEGPKVSIFKRIFGPIPGLMRFLTGWIDPIDYNYSEGFSYSYPSLLQRAQMKFRFGFSDQLGVEESEDANSGFKSNAVSKSTKYSLKSGTVFLGGLRTDVSFSRSISQDVVKSGSRSKNVSTVFPDITFSIRPLSTFTFFNPLIKRFSPRTKYTRSSSESYNLTTGNRTSKKSSVAQSPLLAISFGIMQGLQINFKTDRSVTETRNYNSANGIQTNASRSTSLSSTVSTQYAFSWPTGIKIPVLGRIKFKSAMSISLDVSMRNQKNETSSGSGPMISSGERSDMMITTSMTYSFSSQIKGGLSGRWQDTDDKKTKRKSHTRELRIWVDIRF